MERRFLRWNKDNSRSVVESAAGGANPHSAAELLGVALGLFHFDLLTLGRSLSLASVSLCLSLSR